MPRRVNPLNLQRPKNLCQLEARRPGLLERSIFRASEKEEYNLDNSLLTAIITLMIGFATLVLKIVEVARSK